MFPQLYSDETISCLDRLKKSAKDGWCEIDIGDFRFLWGKGFDNIKVDDEITVGEVFTSCRQMIFDATLPETVIDEMIKITKGI